MTVKQLIKKLQSMPQTSKVVIVVASGSDPNGSPLDSVERGHYRVDSTWAGYVKHPDDVEDEDERVVVLWPVHS